MKERACMQRRVVTVIAIVVGTAFLTLAGFTPAPPAASAVGSSMAP